MITPTPRSAAAVEAVEGFACEEEGEIVISEHSLISNIKSQ
jgi:hypothetical protein